MRRVVTEADVHTAADDVAAAGGIPTVRAIHAQLQRGSFKTIQRYLQTWEQRARMPTLPDTLQQRGATWLETVWNEACAAMRAQLTARDTYIADLRRERDELQHQLDEANQTIHQLRDPQREQ